jgi:diguanylate cyclase (GGDEF)-like protein
MGIDPKGKFEKGAKPWPIHSRRGFNDQSDLIFGHKKYLLSNDVQSRYKEGLGDGSIIYNMALVPIYAGTGKPIGTLAVDNLNRYRRITQADVAFLFDYSTLLGLVIQSARNYKNAVSLSVTDPMTGLGNRRSFELRLEQEIKRAQRYKRPFSLLIGDIDFFKKVNDTYGHDVGDKVIRHMAQILKVSIRQMDTVARIGGEEFAILLPEIELKDLTEVIDRVLARVRQSKAPLPVRTPPPVTMSFGAALYRKGKVVPSQIFKLADKSLYAAKRGGRNACGPLEVIGK